MKETEREREREREGEERAVGLYHHHTGNSFEAVINSCAKRL